MDLITDIPAMRQAVATTLMTVGADLPEDTRAAVVAASGEVSPVTQFGDTCEALYARLADLPDEAMVLCGQLANICRTYGWLDLGQTDRGEKILGAVLRELGEGAQAEADDPAPLARFSPADEDEAA